MYSSAVFETPEMGPEQASEAKLGHICHKLELQPDDHVLEIGTGCGTSISVTARRVMERSTGNRQIVYVKGDDRSEPLPTI